MRLAAVFALVALDPTHVEWAAEKRTAEAEAAHLSLPLVKKNHLR